MRFDFGIFFEPNVHTFVLQLLSDRFFTYPLYRALKMHIANAKSGISFYHFEYCGQFSVTDTIPLFGGRDVGPVHGDDSIYLFDMPAKYPAGLNEQDQRVSEQYVNHIVEFVVTQTPPRNIHCREMKPMCSHLSFVGSARKGSFEEEITMELDMDLDLVEFWDEFGSLSY